MFRSIAFPALATSLLASALLAGCGQQIGERHTQQELTGAIASWFQQQGSGQMLELPDGGQTRVMLANIHRNRLERLDEDTYFGCAEVTTEEGDPYVVNLTLQSSPNRTLRVVDPELYDPDDPRACVWRLADGGWRRAPRRQPERFIEEGGGPGEVPGEPGGGEPGGGMPETGGGEPSAPPM